MVYVVKTPTEHFGGVEVNAAVERLLNEWLVSAQGLLQDADDPKSRRFALAQQACKDVYSIQLWDGPALTMLAEQVLAAARETIAEDQQLEARITPIVEAITGLLRGGPPSRPSSDDGERPNDWDTLTEKLEAQFKSLVELLREQGSILAMMHSCTQVLGQLLNRDHDHMLLLLKDGDLAALALVEGGNVHDLLTKPAHLAAGTRGAGSALMEYIVRRAKAKGQRVSLIPLDSAALRVYVAWGFTGNMSGMVLLPEAADRLLRRYTNFAAHVFQ